MRMGAATPGITDQADLAQGISELFKRLKSFQPAEVRSLACRTEIAAIFAFCDCDRHRGYLNPKGPNLEKIQSRLKFSISLENFNLAWNFQSWPLEFATKIGVWWAARLKFSISFDNFNPGGRSWFLFNLWALREFASDFRDFALRFEGAMESRYSDLRFRVAIPEPKTPSFCVISGDLAPSTRKSLVIVTVRFWCAKGGKQQQVSERRLIRLTFWETLWE